MACPYHGRRQVIFRGATNAQDLWRLLNARNYPQEDLRIAWLRTDPRFQDRQRRICVPFRVAY